MVYVEEGQHLYSQGLAHGLVAVKVNLEKYNIRELLHELQQLVTATKQHRQGQQHLSVQAVLVGAECAAKSGF